MSKAQIKTLIKELGGSGRIMNVVLTQEEHNKLGYMLRGIARKYAGWGGIDFEDIEQECWVKALEIVNDMGEVNYRFIAQSCFNRIFDLGRYQSRRVNQIPVDPSCYDFNNDTSSDETDEVKGFRYEPTNFSGLPVGNDFDSNLVIEEIEALFENDKNALEYIRELQIYIGVKTVSAKEFDEIFGNENVENEIAWNLGFANSTSNGYRNVKRRVRRIIAEYYGMEDRVKNC